MPVKLWPGSLFAANGRANMAVKSAKLVVNTGLIS